jgi:hypothetical protein
MRYFRANETVYEQARAALDAAWGHPSADGETLTCIEPAATAPRDASGMIVIAVHDAFTALSVASVMLPQLLAAGAVAETDAAEYKSALDRLIPTPTPTPQDPAPFNFSPNPTLSVFTPKKK